jgi:hypothetical protein
MNGSQVVYGSSTPLVVPLKTNGQRKFHPKTLRAFSAINILLGLISCVLMVISAIIAFTENSCTVGYSTALTSNLNLEVTYLILSTNLKTLCRQNLYNIFKYRIAVFVRRLSLYHSMADSASRGTDQSTWLVTDCGPESST